MYCEGVLPMVFLKNLLNEDLGREAAIQGKRQNGEVLLILAFVLML